jgi:aspartate/methionine/tyrosine aminotransferase
MRSAHVAVTPGRDFGRVGSERYIRLSYASSMDRLELAVRRLGAVLAKPPPSYG